MNTETTKTKVRTNSTGIVHLALIFKSEGRKDQTMIICGSKQAVTRVAADDAAPVTCKRCGA